MTLKIREGIEPGLVLFGILALVTGFGIGAMMYAHPEGLNPSWPLWMAMVAAAVFVLGGVHMVAAGLGLPGIARATLGGAAVCLLAVANWAAFFTKNVQCVATLSFLGESVLTRYPSEAECRWSLRVLMSGFDALLLLLLVGAFVWRKRQRRNG